MSKFADRRPDASLAKLVSFNRGDVSDRAPGSWAQTGTLVGNAAVSGGVLVLDGTGDYLTYPDATHLDMPSAFSGSIWFEPSTPGAVNRSLFAKYLGTGSQRSYYLLASYGSGFYQIIVSATGGSVSGGNAIQYNFTSSIPTSGWHHAAIVVNTNASATNRAKLYIDGVSLSPTVIFDHSAFTPFNSNRVLEVGALEGTLSWKGNLDDFRLYRRALTAAEVGAIYSSGRQ